MSASRRESLQLQALDLLVNAPSSFAALYRFVGQEIYPERPNVAEAFGAMVDLSNRGLLVMERDTDDGVRRDLDDLELRRLLDAYIEWLGTTPSSQLAADEVSLDEVGLWCSITERGRAVWASQIEGEDIERLWTLDDDCVGQLLVIRAVDLLTAERAVDTWTSLNPSMHVVTSSRTVGAESFRTGDGSLREGVCLTLRYENATTDPGDKSDE